jgi:hypothetical protein
VKIIKTNLTNWSLVFCTNNLLIHQTAPVMNPKPSKIPKIIINELPELNIVYISIFNIEKYKRLFI